MKPRLKINFASFWPDFCPYDNYFFIILSQVYDVEISRRPDFLIYSKFDDDFAKYNGIRIFYTGENVRPNFEECDYSFTFDYDDYQGRNYRLPLCAARFLDKLLDRKNRYIYSLDNRPKFCSLVVSNGDAKERNDLFHMLSKYKKVDSGGRYLNNVGGPVENKIKFIGDYKFTIAFENESYEGYTTEKIVDAFVSGSLPIYWGNPKIETDFNPKSFINAHDFKTMEALVDHIIAVDRDDDLYRSYIQEPCFEHNKMPPSFKPEAVLARFEEILKNKDQIKPVAQTWVGRRRSFARLVNRYRWMFFKK